MSHHGSGIEGLLKLYKIRKENWLGLLVFMQSTCDILFEVNESATLTHQQTHTTDPKWHT